MGLFGKLKKSSCCAIQFEEVKEVKNKKSSCCDVQIEEVKDEDKLKKTNNDSCSE